MTDPLEPHATIRTAGPPRLGGTLGRYQLMEILGHGAMATVFRARDTNLGREVALKVMTLAVAARADSAERFRREAQAVAAVKHPGIVEVFDFVTAQLEAGEPAYIVSELIRGPTLRKFLDGRRGRLLPETAALIALPLAEALQAAHSHGVVHRDIKPDNVMLEHGEGARVVLTDFGVAHVTGLETMTATGALVGSPSYMSPEQGRGDDVGPASDLFSLGILLYEMATGHLPFTGRDPLQVLASIGRGIYKRPGQVSPFVSPAFDELCCRCLRATASERFASAGALAAALRALCKDAGLDTDGGALRAFLDDPEAFEAALRPRLADAAVASARRHGRRGELARALAELSRATAYVPGHAEAEKLCVSISSRRRWAKGALIGGGVIAVACGAIAVTNVVGHQWAEWRRRVEAEVEEARPALEAQRRAHEPQRAQQPQRPEAGTTGPPPPLPSAQPATGAPGPTGGAPARRELARRAAARRPAAKAAALAAEPPPPAAEAAALVVETPVVAPPPAALPPVDVHVVISASRAFCEPGIDGLAAQLSPVETTVKAGRHRVHCTLPGSSVWSTDLEIGPTADGSPFVILIARGDDLKPHIDWKRTSKAKPPERPAPAATSAPAIPAD
jgi:hypothetical protein